MLQGLAASGCKYVFIDGAQLTFSDTNVLGSLGMLGNAYHQEHQVGIHFYRFSEPNKKILRSLASINWWAFMTPQCSATALPASVEDVRLDTSMNQAFQHLPGHWPPAPSPSELDGQRVVVWGIGKHGGGIAAARHGARHGAKVAFLDRDQPSDELRRQIKAEGWAIYQGDLSHPDIADADWVVISPAIPLAILRRQPPIQASFISAEGLSPVHTKGNRW